MLSIAPKHSLMSAAMLSAVFVAAAFADETPTHYAAEPSETLQEAVTNFISYTDRVEAVLARDPLTDDDMEEVHELTYTLEDALARINKDMAALPEVLETLHLASEGDDAKAMKDAADAFLITAKAFQGS